MFHRVLIYNDYNHNMMEWMSLEYDRIENIEDKSEQKRLRAFYEHMIHSITDYRDYLEFYNKKMMLEDTIKRRIKFDKSSLDTGTLKRKWEDSFTGMLTSKQKKDSYMNQFLWHAFSYKLLDSMKDILARNAFDYLVKSSAFVFFQDNEEAYYIEDASFLKASDFEFYDDVYVVDKDFKWTYIKTHECMCGPYFYNKEEMEKQLEKIHSFDRIEDFIEHVKSKDDVIGIVEYGGRSFDNMYSGGDYDLSIILNKKISTNFNGVHFHIRKIPVDCMILSVEDFEESSPKNPFYLVHLDCKILFDRDNKTKKLLEKIHVNWAPNQLLSSFEKHLFRFSFQHILDKLERRLYDDPLFTRVFIHSSFDWYLECYARINHLKVGQPKAHLEYIRANDMELYKLVNMLYSTVDIEKQFSALKRCAEKIMSPLGGLWKKNELLLHLLPEGEVVEEEENRVVNLLFR